MNLRRFLAICATLLMPLQGNAVTFSSDATDLWWVASENGWGVNVVQQDNILFATFFVYGSDSKASWLVASGLAYAGANSAGGLIYTGPLYQTTGPWLGGAFNPNNVGVRQVGTATFTLQTIADALLSYTVDGVRVNKNLTRLTWRNNPVAGSYLGGSAGTWSQCSSGNGYQETPGNVTITQSGTRVTMTFNTCTFNGTYNQTGRIGEIYGTYSCPSGTGGDFQLWEVDASYFALSAVFEAQSGATCKYSGRIGGVLRK